jgi:hypothetical protein
MTDSRLTRREAMAAVTSSLVAMSASSHAEDRTSAELIVNHNASLQQALEAQVTDPQSPWCGAYPDKTGLYHCHSAARILRDGAASFLHPESRFCGSKDLFQRMKLAAANLKRCSVVRMPSIRRGRIEFVSRPDSVCIRTHMCVVLSANCPDQAFTSPDSHHCGMD